MASKLDVLKRYQSKKKKNSKNKASNDVNNIQIYDEQNLKSITSDPKTFDQPDVTLENDMIEADENPIYFMEDGVTRVPQDYFKNMSHKQGKWVPVGSYSSTKADSPKKDIPIQPTLQTRHDSDSDEEVTDVICENKNPTDDDFSPDRLSSSDFGDRNVKSRRPPVDPIVISRRSRTTEVRPKKTHEVISNRNKERTRESSEIQWGPGCYQTREKKRMLEEMTTEMAKPLARYKDDKDLETHLKSIVRAEDPLKDYVAKPEPVEPVIKSNHEKSKKQCKYRFQNRFDIAPGCRWDGVDRSNGFEKRRIERINEISNQEREAYMYFAEEI